MSKVVIDPGHGGKDPGSSGNNIIEKDLNLKISKYMYDRFKELNIPVSITRDKDETLSPTTRVNRVIDAFGNNSDVIVLSNHINAGGGDGAEVIYALRDNDKLSKLILEELNKEGQNIRKWYQRRSIANPEKDYFFIHRNTGVTEPVIIEYGFLDSTKDDVSLLKNNYEDFAEAVVRAVMKYINKEYIPKESDNVYVVQKGDSLYKISEKFNVSIESIRNLNNLKSDFLNVGDILKIPTITEDQSKDYIVYVVKKDDNLYKIAKIYNTTVDDIINYNNLSTSILKIDQQLLIPTKKEEIDNEETIIYTVKFNDNLYSIANKYNTTVNEIKRINNLSSDTLSINQQLLIPTSKTSLPEENIYIVKKGDNLWSIARNFNTTVESIVLLNNLNSTNLSINQKLLIPIKEISPISPPSNNEIIYIVQQNDNLWDISRRFNVSVNEIISNNNLKTNLLSVGQTLKIPVENEVVLYTVKSNDNLWDIANKYNVTVTKIKNYNNLATNNLSIGQKILIPL